MLQNARVTAFTVSELLRENQKGGKIATSPRLRLTRSAENSSLYFFEALCLVKNFRLAITISCL